MLSRRNIFTVAGVAALAPAAALAATPAPSTEYVRPIVRAGWDSLADTMAGLDPNGRLLVLTARAEGMELANIVLVSLLFEGEPRLMFRDADGQMITFTPKGRI